MNHFLTLILGATLVLGACSSLPSHPETTGAAILLLDFDNQSSRTDPIHRVELELSNGRSFTFLPHHGQAVIPVRDPDLRVTAVRISLQAEHWSGGDNRVAVSIPLGVAPGRVMVVPNVFRYTQEDVKGRSGYYHSQWRLVPLEASRADEGYAALKADPDIDRWTLGGE